MIKYLTEIKSSKLIENAINVYKQKKAGDIPVLNGIEFQNAFKTGYCQQHIRKLVEATIWGKEWQWSEAACCATRTGQKIKSAGYENLEWDDVEIGDFVYTSGGGKCRTCGQPVGHTMLYVYDENNNKMMWQNTSYEKRGLDIIPIRDSQVDAITGIFRLLPQDDNIIKIIDIKSNQILAVINGDYKLVADHLSDQDKIYLERI